MYKVIIKRVATVLSKFNVGFQDLRRSIVRH